MVIRNKHGCNYLFNDSSLLLKYYRMLSVFRRCFQGSVKREVYGKNKEPSRSKLEGYSDKGGQEGFNGLYQLETVDGSFIHWN